MIALRLKTNYLSSPIGIDPGKVVLTWSPGEGLRQTAFRITVEAEGNLLWDSGKVISSRTEYVPPVEIPSRTQAKWSVTLWDEKDAPGTPVSAAFETGMCATDWTAKWIDPELVHPEYCTRAIDDFPLNRASYLRKEFNLSQFNKARLYITAHGVYNVWINGVPIEDFFMAPGYSDYDHRLQVQTYDIGHALKKGRNEILVTIGEGWWRGSTGWSMFRYLYGVEIALLCQLETDGSPVVCSDESWQASQNGPLEENDTMRLERYDARKEIRDWHSVKEVDHGYQKLVGTALPIATHERFPAKLLITPNGQRVLDFGQNFAGYVQLDLMATGGEKIVLTHGEVLDQYGNFQNDNFQNKATPLCRQVVEYTCKPGRNQFHQTKCFYGFRYVLLETDLPLTGAEFTGVAVYSDMEQTGFFSCGNPEVNRLFQNCLWSMKSNFVDIPTDCPHREKLGFTGDLQVFSDAALYLMDSFPVILRWLREVATAQYPNGCVPYVVPRRNTTQKFRHVGKDGSAGWCDAFHIIPYRMMRRWDSDVVVEELYPNIKRWLMFNLERAKQSRPENENLPNIYRDYILDTADNWGEWCEPGRSPADYRQEGATTGQAEIATAFLAQGCFMIYQMAQRLGKAEDAEFFRDAYEKGKAAYRYAFTKDGLICSDRQCHYVRPIAHDLLSEAEKQAAADALASNIRANGNTLNTGFLTTCHLCDVLTDYGHASVAYDLLLQTKQPSWLYAVQHDATTIWEDWYAIQDDGTRKDSHNHYAFGAISAWMFSRVLGITILDGKITLRPYPDRRLGFAEGSYLSPLGKIGTSWKYEGDEILFTFEVPCNNEATVILPDGQIFQIAPGTHTFRIHA